MNNGISNMSIDKFGRFLNTSYIDAASGSKDYSHTFKLPFALTAENDLNILNKRLINIGFPRTANDAVTKEYVDQYSKSLIKQQEDDIRKIRDSVTILINKLDNETRELATKLSVLEEIQDMKIGDMRTTITQYVNDQIQGIRIKQQEEFQKVTFDLTALKEQMGNFIKAEDTY